MFGIEPEPPDGAQAAVNLAYGEAEVEREPLSLTSILDPNESYAELLALSVLLEPVRKAKRVVQFEALEDVQTSAEHNFPACISGDVTIMLSPCRVIRPSELNTHPSTGICNFLQAFGLTITVELILHGDHMYSHFLTGNQLLADRLHQFHEVAQLMEHPQVRINNDDPLSPFQIGPKQPIEGDTALVLLNN